MVEILGKEFLQQLKRTPTSTKEWEEIFTTCKSWNFPNGVEADDGKDIVIQQTKNSGSHYRNYKWTDSIILLRMIGPEYKFLYADVGMNGKNSDGGNWSQNQLKNNTLNIPEPRALSHRIKNFPYVCTGDDAFSLYKFMMKPSPQKNLSAENCSFGYRLSRMRGIFENGFGI